MLAVRVDLTHGPVWYGPLKSEHEAARFAAFLDTEVTGEAVVEDVPFGTRLLSPVEALMTWRDAVLAEATIDRLITDLIRKKTPAAAETPEAADQEGNQ